jgi:hypothetical protein
MSLIEAPLKGNGGAGPPQVRGHDFDEVSDEPDQQREQAQLLRDLVEFGRLLRARPDQDRQYVIEQLRGMAHEQGFPELVIPAMRKVWPQDERGNPPSQRARGVERAATATAPPLPKRDAHQRIPRRRASSTPRAPARFEAEAEAPRKHFIFEWRNGFCAVLNRSRESGLPAMTRLVLWTVSRLMNKDGTGAYQGQGRIAKEAGLSLPAVKFHLQLAVKRGWLSRERTHESRFGLSYQYVATLPRNEGATSLPGNRVARKRDEIKGATSCD